MRCHYCDSAYAFSGGDLMPLEDVVAKALSYQPRYLTVTGGEPLAQPTCLELLSRLCEHNLQVSLETGGAISIAGVDERVSIVLDIKTPASGEVDNNDWSNIEKLRPKDQVKFVLCDRQDYEWARFKLDELELGNKVNEVLFSPSHEQLAPRELADWIVADNVPVRMQLQMHKYLWGDRPGY